MRWVSQVNSVIVLDFELIDHSNMTYTRTAIDVISIG